MKLIEQQVWMQRFAWKGPEYSVSISVKPKINAMDTN